MSRSCKGTILFYVSLTKHFVYFTLLPSLCPAHIELLSVTTLLEKTEEQIPNPPHYAVFSILLFFQIFLFAICSQTQYVHPLQLVCRPQKDLGFMFPSPPPPPPHLKRVPEVFHNGGLISGQNNHAGSEQHRPFVKDERSSTRKGNKYK